MAQTEFNWDERATAMKEAETIEERFAEFDRLCPEVYREFKRLAHQVRDAGHKHYGAKGLFEVMRFHRAVDGRDVDRFKLNNIFTSRYVRKLIEDDPTFEGFFELRELKAK